MAQLFYDLGKYEKALAHCRDALRLKPDHVGMRLQSANLLLELGSLAEAVSQYQKALKLNPIDVRIEDIRHYLRDLNCSNHVYKNVLGAMKVFFRDFLNRLEVVDSFKFTRADSLR